MEDERYEMSQRYAGEKGVFSSLDNNDGTQGPQKCKIYIEIFIQQLKDGFYSLPGFKKKHKKTMYLITFRNTDS